MVPRRRTSRSRATFRAVLAAALTALAGAPAAADAASIPSHRVAEPAASVRQYWTPERMAGALPAELLLRGLPAPGALPAREVGAPRVIGSAQPAPRGAIDDLLGGGGQQQRRAQQISNPRRAPFRTHGKVFFTMSGVDYLCSATAVRARNRRLVTTAGHCVYSMLEGYADNWAFIPAYRDGARPYGKWTALRLATTRQWRNDEDIRYDVGMAVMRKRKGKRLQRVVGGRGIAFNLTPRRYHAYGYPADDPYNGQRLYMCNSRLLGTDGSESRPRPRRIECDMTGGSSGGGWVVREELVNSVTSYGYECVTDPLIIIPCDNPEENRLFGPYFGESVRKLYRSQQRPLRRG